MRTSNLASLIVTLGTTLFLVACGSSGGGGNNGDGGNVDGDGGAIVDAGGVDFSDADPLAPDAGPGGCVATGPQCNNCIDDDEDGQIDGFDIECTGLIDDDESGFATGISGDNIDTKTQDCFFDGNSGGGDDKCAYHTCCIFGFDTAAECPSNLQPPNYDPADCEVTAQCIANCGPLVPPGCDCFGCCTLCDGAGCVDVYTNPAVAPECDADVLHDATKCPTCEKLDSCDQPCGPEMCILCPGQNPEDLPPECTEVMCPTGATTCETTADCNEFQFCSVGCCIGTVD
jgi:hypothetical protein